MGSLLVVFHSQHSAFSLNLLFCGYIFDIFIDFLYLNIGLILLVFKKKTFFFCYSSLAHVLPVLIFLTTVFLFYSGYLPILFLNEFLAVFYYIG